MPKLSIGPIKDMTPAKPKEGVIVIGRDTGVHFMLLNSTEGVALESKSYVKAGHRYNIASGSGYTIVPVGYTIGLTQSYE